MIQWIALALAADAECKASDAKRRSRRALHGSRKAGVEDPLVIVRPVDLVDVYERDTFWGRIFGPSRKVLARQPWSTLSIKRSDIESLEAYNDSDGEPYVFIKISEYANVRRENNAGEEMTIIGLRVPGTIEYVTRVLNGGGDGG